MSLMTKEIGEELQPILKVAAAGVKKKGKLVYLVEEIVGRRIVVLKMLQLEKTLTVELYLLIGGMMLVIEVLDMICDGITSGHLGGVLKTKIRNLGLKKGQM